MSVSGQINVLPSDTKPESQGSGQGERITTLVSKLLFNTYSLLH